jgi:hypothetical protein
MKLPGTLGHPDLRRMSDNVGNVNTARPNVDEKEDIDGLQANRFHREAIAHQ